MSSEKTHAPVLPSHLQVRAGRQLLEWTQQDLADHSGVGRATIDRFERGNWKIQKIKLEMIRAAFQTAGVVFTNGDNPTVSFQKSRLDKRQGV